MTKNNGKNVDLQPMCAEIAEKQKLIRLIDEILRECQRTLGIIQQLRADLDDVAGRPGSGGQEDANSDA